MTHGRRDIIVTLGAIGTGGLAGCSLLEDDLPIEDLELQVQDLRAPDAGVTTSTVPVVLLVENPTATSIPSPTGDFDGWINGQRALTTHFSLSTVAPNDVFQEQINLSVDHAEVGRAIVDVLASREFRLRLDGFVESEGHRAEQTLTATYEG